MTEPRTIPQLFLDRAQRTPDELCQRHKHRGVWKRFTWGQVHIQVREVGLGLAALGLERGEMVAIIGENAPQFHWAEYGALAMGAKVVSLYPDATTDEMARILTESEAVYLFAEDQEQVDKALAIVDRNPKLRKVIYWDGKGMWSYEDALLAPFDELKELGRRLDTAEPMTFVNSVAAGRGGDIAIMSYTSGTSGKPKGVFLSHQYFFDNASRFNNAVNIPAGSEYLSYISPAWSVEQLFGMFMGLWRPMVINFPESPEQVLANLREIAVDVLVFGPRQWESLATSVQARMFNVGIVRKRLFEWGMKIGKAVNVSRVDGKAARLFFKILYPLAEFLVLKPLRDNLGLVRIKVALSGGSAMAPDVFKYFCAMGVPLRNFYGTTECGILTAHQGKTFDVETIGRWLGADPVYGPQLEWRIDSNGELQVRGNTGFAGYYGHDGNSEDKNIDGWFPTGDAVVSKDGGEVMFLDRVDDLRKLSTGHVYPPQFIETKLRFSPFVKDVMIVGTTTHPHVAALVNIDPVVVGRWAEERNVAFSTFADLSQNPEILRLVRDELRRVNTLLPASSKVRRFANFPNELSPDEGELTRTRKLRRGFLENRYEALVEALYDGRGEVDCEISVRHRDGRRAVLNVRVAAEDVEKAGSVAAIVGHETVAATGDASNLVRDMAAGE